MDWLDKHIGRNRAGAPPMPDHLSIFKEVLAPLDEARPGLAIQTAVKAHRRSSVINYYNLVEAQIIAEALGI